MFFLMASERSGSNFITKLMNGHNNICGPSAKHIINPVARNLFRYGDLSIKKNWYELINDIYNLMEVKFSVWQKRFTLDDLQKLSNVGDISSLIINIFLEEARANGKQHVFIKENHVYEFMPFLLLNFPESKFIYLTRDPRDMALSWKKNTDHAGGVVSAARQWQKDQQNTLKNYYELEKLNKSFHVKYEDLISDPELKSAEIVKFLGLPEDKNMINFYKDELTQKNAEMIKAWGNLSKEVIKDNKNKYIDELNKEEIKIIEKICYHEMYYLGYKTEYNKEHLDTIDANKIIALDEFETKNVLSNKNKAVLENMSAKKVFYNKLLGKINN